MGADGRGRDDTLDVALRLAQIAALQAGFYLSLTVTLTLVGWISGLTPDLALVLSSSSIDFSYAQGWTPALAHLIACVPVVFGVAVAAADRPRDCLDFACTLYIVHVVVVAVYMGRAPSETAWWITVLVSVIIVAVASEIVCIRRMGRAHDPIPLTEIVAHRSTPKQ